jgi:RimJ/RimL family protein N-acetyltransferase
MAQRFPDRVLESDRLLLRPFSEADIADVREACGDELVRTWLPVPVPYTLESARDWCTRVTPTIHASGDGIQFAAVPRAGGRLAACVGLKKTDWPARVSEIGYWVAPWARGRGYATESVRTIGRWLLRDLGFERMELRAAPGNHASLRVAERAGLVREGVLRNAGSVHSGRVDLVLYSLVPSDLTDPGPPGPPAPGASVRPGG